MTHRWLTAGRLAPLLGLLWVPVFAAPAEPANPAAAKTASPAALAPAYRQWLDEVALLLRKEERQAFLALKEDYQRDGFIRDFWAARDPYPETGRNEFKETWYRRIDDVRRLYGGLTEDRARFYLLHGEPAQTWKTDCQLELWPLEIWYYPRAERLPSGFYAIFTQRAASGPFRLWIPAEGTDDLVALTRNDGTEKAARADDGKKKAAGGLRDLAEDALKAGTTLFERLIERYCTGDDRIVVLAFQRMKLQGQIGTLAYTEYPPAPRDSEWLATYLGKSTDLPTSVPAINGKVTLGFPEPHGNRTLVQAVVELPRQSLSAAKVEGEGGYSLLLLGEILKDDALQESFRYRFDLPAAGLPESVPLVFERLLRPGDYTLIVRVEDLTGKRNFREVQPFTVPRLDAAPRGAEVATALDAAREDLAKPESAPLLHLVPPPGETATGGVRIEAKVTAGAIHKIAFALDGKPFLTKSTAPWSVDLTLGTLPTPHTVRAVGFDEAGKEVASDELTLNAAPQRFAVHLVEPRRGEHPPGGISAFRGGQSVRVSAELKVPDGQSLDRLELFLDERRVATLYQAPFTQPVVLPTPLPRYIRALAYLVDGSTTEDLILLNTPGYQENVDVPLVEIYAGVKDAQGHRLLDLNAGDFRVLDGGTAQEVVRFERVKDLPISAALMIDTSASMVASLGEAQRAALGFLHAVLSPRDRVALIPFSESPRLAVKLTHDLPTLAGALAGLQAERGTVLWDSLVYGLHYLQGVRGQRALLLLTDGGDRASHFSFAETLEYARRSGVAVYAVGLAVSRLDLEVRRSLSKLADETGGKSFFPDQASDLTATFAQINDELRSRYLLVYQPSASPKAGEYRPVAVEVDRPGVTVEALHGYYP